jgi:hypothetical protein
MSAEKIKFDPQALYDVKALADLLGCCEETIKRRFNCQVFIAGCIRGSDIIKALQDKAPAPELPIEPRKRGRPCKKPIGIQVFRSEPERR